MKNQILGIVTLGVLGACKSEPKDEVGRYALIGYHSSGEQYSIFDTRTGTIVDYQWDNNKILETKEISISGQIKITKYNEQDSSCVTQFNLSFDKYKLHTPEMEKTTETQMEAPADSAAAPSDSAATSYSDRSIESQQERKELYRKLLTDPAARESTSKYSFKEFEEILLNNKTALGKISKFAVKKSWAIDEDDFIYKYAPELAH